MNNDFKAGDSIRRKNHPKQKNKVNKHPIVTIKEFNTYDSNYLGKNIKSTMVVLLNKDGSLHGNMGEEGLDWYEKVNDAGM